MLGEFLQSIRFTQVNPQPVLYLALIRTPMNRSRKRSVVVLFCSLFALYACTDNDIEGAVATSGFSISKTTLVNGPTNGGSCSSGSKFGTVFNITIEYKGNDAITNVKLVYKIGTGSSQTVTLQPFIDYDDSRTSGSGSSSGGFRSAASTNTIEHSRCLNFCSSASATFDYTLTTSTSKTYTTQVIINKPTGAN